MPGFHAGRPPRNEGRRYPADPPTVTEIIAVMRQAGEDLHRRRLRGLIVVLWRAGLRIHEALALNEADLDPRRGSVLVRRAKGGRRRQVGMDDWAWEQLEPSSHPRRPVASTLIPAGASRPLRQRDLAATDGWVPCALGGTVEKGAQRLPDRFRGRRLGILSAAGSARARSS